MKNCSTVKAFVLAVWTVFAVLLTACGYAGPSPAPAEPSPTAAPTPTPSPSPTPVPPPSIEETDPPAWTGQAADFTGEWHRTNIYIAFPGEVKIVNQTEQGFDFSGWGSYYSHSGEIEGTAYFVDENTAFWRYVEDHWTGTVTFNLLENGSLSLEQSGQLPFGMNAGIAGEYTLDEPVYYTNGILEALGPERIALLQEIAGEDYQAFFGTPLEYGDFTIEEYREGGYSGLFLTGWLPTFGYHQKIYISDDGAVWANFWTGQCFTNRSREEMPDFLLFPENS